MMRIFGVIGYPLGHSLSPTMHNAAFAALGIEAEYSKFQIPPDNFDETIQEMKRGTYDGLNVTIPYKRRILKYIDIIDPDAEAIGAANTVKKEGTIWKGYNTDIPGFIAPLLTLNQPPKRCLLLGTGGAARAVIYSIGKYLQPEHITIAARNKEKYDDIDRQIGPLVDPVQLAYVPFDEVTETSDRFDLIVNATPLGTFPHTGESPLPDIRRVKRNVAVYDLIYNPQETKFLADIKNIAPESKRINGLEMLIGQAAHSFKIWTGEEMPRDLVKTQLLKML